jgi:ABC-2 type transport system permease protein
MDRGVMNRFLTAPASRGALIAGSLIYSAIMGGGQSLIILGMAALTGAHLAGIGGILLLLLVTTLISVAFGSFSNSVALTLRKQESLIGAVNFLILPLTFLSSPFMQQDLTPKWMQLLAPFNPVNWAVTAGRIALSANLDWSTLLSQSGYLAALALACAWLSTRAFRAYQRSISRAC